MKLLKYKYNDPSKNGWDFSEVSFGKINLLVGNTGSGKTRFLNTLFNIASAIANPKNDLRSGRWDIEFQISEKIYSWKIEVDDKVTSKPVIKSEQLIQVQENGDKVTIFERDSKTFFFLGNPMPKLSLEQSGLTILKDEELISPIYRGFGALLRRPFSLDALNGVTQYGIVPLDSGKTRRKSNTDDIFLGNYPLNINLFLLKKNFPLYFEEICTTYRNIFPFIEEIKILDFTDLHKSIKVAGKIPVFCIKEKGNNDLVELGDLSSGMQKVLLIISDFFILPKEGIYLLDEYENSLGSNAIDFLPVFLKEHENTHQYIITSHHPYLISNIPTKNWYIFHRKNKKVSIIFGDEVVKKYGKSKQDAFSQLINDPFYLNGIE